MFTLYCTDPNRLQETVEGTLAHAAMLCGVQRLGVAVSGGADSVALFHLMRTICVTQGITLVVLHLNHGLRGAASDEDERFVRTLAESAACACQVGHAHLTTRHTDNQSLEMAAREARLAFFRQSSREAKLDAIATGHHADDVAETLFLRLMRGAGGTGLAGLRPTSLLPQSNTPLIRPLLAVASQALRGWLSQQGLLWREDESNHDPSITRNRLRHIILPELELGGFTALRKQLCRSAAILREDEILLDQLTTQALETLMAHPGAAADALPVEPLLHYPEALQRRILRQWLFQQGCTEATGYSPVTTLLARCTNGNGHLLSLAGDKAVYCYNGLLTLNAPKKVVRLSEAVLPPMGTCVWGDFVITTTPAHGKESLAHGIGCYPACCTLSLVALDSHTLLIRTRQPGDRIAPTGLGGSKKIQDLFTDEKIPEAERDTLPLLICDGQVAWVPGYRIAERFAVPRPDAPSLRITITRATD